MRIAHEDEQAPCLITAYIRRLLPEVSPPSARPVILCIGTDRSTGDALGPLVGQRLRKDLGHRAVILGTLDTPVHAGNLLDALDTVETSYKRSPIIAIDACLGQAENVGTLTVGKGTLRPGAGVNKNLPAVGDIFITGTVNVGGMMEYLVLQNTRLSLVMRMAETICSGIEGVFYSAPDNLSGTNQEKAALSAASSLTL